DVPVYPTLPAHQIAYVLRDAGCRMVVCSTREQLEKLRTIRSELPALEQVIVCDDGIAYGDEKEFSALEAAGARETDRWPDWQADALTVQPDDLATLIYTAGTTGDPKGVMLSHGNIASNVAASLDVLKLSAGWECLSFLPLSHSFERMAG